MITMKFNHCSIIKVSLCKHENWDTFPFLFSNLPLLIINKMEKETGNEIIEKLS